MCSTETHITVSQHARYYLFLFTMVTKKVNLPANNFVLKVEKQNGCCYVKLSDKKNILYSDQISFKISMLSPYLSALLPDALPK